MVFLSDAFLIQNSLLKKAPAGLRIRSFNRHTDCYQYMANRLTNGVCEAGRHREAQGERFSASPTSRPSAREGALPKTRKMPI